LRCPDSFYENFPTPAALDLANTQAFTMTPVAGGYSVTAGTSPYLPPSASATSLALTDDTEVTVALTTPFPFCGSSTSALTVCSNGFVSVATGNGTSFTPFVPALLGAPQTGWWNWHDYNPAAVGSGAIKFEEVAGVAYVTWDGVYDFMGTTPANANTFQFQFTPGGVVHLVYGAMSTRGTNGFLVGFSRGGPSVDPGNSDLSGAGLPTSICCTDLLPLSLTASARPIAGSNMTLLSTNIPAGSPFGAIMVGLAQFPSGIPLASIGMPGCFQYHDNLASYLIVPVTGTSMATNVPLLNPVVNFPGATIYAQSAFYTGSPLAVSSNGLRLLIGQQ
jgi:hypothetical protein